MSKKKKEHKLRLKKRYETLRHIQKKKESKMQEIFEKLLDKNLNEEPNGQKTNDGTL